MTNPLPGVENPKRIKRALMRFRKFSRETPLRAASPLSLRILSAIASKLTINHILRRPRTA